MKKHVIFLFFGIFSCVCFAQDFKNTYWDTDIASFFRNRVLTEQSRGEFSEDDYMLGEKTAVSYFFEHNKLYAAGYAVSYSEKRTIELKEKLTRKYGLPEKIVRLKLFDEKSREEAKQYFENLNKTITYLAYEDIISYYKGRDTALGHILNNEKEGKDSDPIIFMHYRTVFSDIYVLADVFPDRIVVLYKKHVDDF